MASERFHIEDKGCRVHVVYRVHTNMPPGDATMRELVRALQLHATRGPGAPWLGDWMHNIAISIPIRKSRSGDGEQTGIYMGVFSSRYRKLFERIFDLFGPLYGWEEEDGVVSQGERRPYRISFEMPGADPSGHERIEAAQILRAALIGAGVSPEEAELLLAGDACNEA